jgi:hypothetical protein
VKQELPCGICGDLPSSLRIVTGQDQRFPEPVERLQRLRLSSWTDLYRCPSCGSLFEWRDSPQYHGSGRWDAEELTRLPEAKASLARVLLQGEVEPDGARALLDSAFRALGFDLAIALLNGLRRQQLERFELLVPALVERLLGYDTSGYRDLLSDFAYQSPERSGTILGLLTAERREPGQYARELIERLAQWAGADGVTPPAAESSSRDPGS